MTSTLTGLAKLEDFVTGLRGGVVLVSHDREFLARCVTTVVELDLAQNSVAVYDGGYDAFLEERAVAAGTPARNTTNSPPPRRTWFPVRGPSVSGAPRASGTP